LSGNQTQAREELAPFRTQAALGKNAVLLPALRRKAVYSSGEFLHDWKETAGGMRIWKIWIISCSIPRVPNLFLGLMHASAPAHTTSAVRSAWSL
jgi:hypothetical protein